MRITSLAAAATLALSATALGAAPALASGTASSSCADYPDQGFAQAAFEADPEGLAALDPDGNGVACEDTPFIIGEGEPELPGDDDVDCNFFPSWGVAQATYEDVVDSLGDDRYSLDTDDDGIACETFDYGAGKSYDDASSGGAMTMPVGGVDTGAGGAAGDGSTGAAIVAGGALAALGAGGLVLARRRTSAD